MAGGTQVCAGRLCGRRMGRLRWTCRERPSYPVATTRRRGDHANAAQHREDEMAKHGRRGLSRRSLLKGAIAAATVPATARFAAAAEPRKITTVNGVETAADMAKAEAEGAMLFYTHDSDPAGAAIVEAFSKDFPKIKASYLRAQN